MKKGFLIFFGSLFTVLGLVGVFVPVLPTTPFLLLASYCFVRSSEKLNNWLINHRIFGAYIGSYMKYRAVRKDMKIRAVLFLWGSLTLSALLVRNVHVAVFLLLVGIGVTAYIVSLKTLTSEMEETANNETGQNMAEKNRCGWCKGKDFYEKYHDEEWGVPVHDDRTHFEFLILEGAQAGLSWETVLKKRDGYRKAFKNFDPKAVAAMTDTELEAQIENPDIIRNRLKIFAARKNAIAFLKIQEEFGSFDEYVWRFVGGKPIQRGCKTLADVPATSPESDALSKDLKKRGMTFVGSTIIYAHMQATGLVNDHVQDCFRHKDLA